MGQNQDSGPRCVVVNGVHSVGAERVQAVDPCRFTLKSPLLVWDLIDGEKEKVGEAASSEVEGNGSITFGENVIEMFGDSLSEWSACLAHVSMRALLTRDGVDGVRGRAGQSLEDGVDIGRAAVFDGPCGEGVRTDVAD